MNGLLWKDGGPVIGIQLDNEYSGPADYLMALKKIARSAGLDVPFYTKTGWPATATPMPLGEVLPLYGVYADGFWDRDLVAMGGDKWMSFAFSLGRNDAKYPYLCCEIGGGMETSYHRRILVDPRDVESVALVQLGDGSSLLGYYMYQGGQNPDGKLTTLKESQATGYSERFAGEKLRFSGAARRIRPDPSAISLAATPASVPARLRQCAGRNARFATRSQAHEPQRLRHAALGRALGRTKRICLRQQLPAAPADAAEKEMCSFN